MKVRLGGADKGQKMVSGSPRRIDLHLGGEVSGWNRNEAFFFSLFH